MSGPAFRIWVTWVLTATFAHHPDWTILDMSDSYSSNVIMSFWGYMLHVTSCFYSSFVSRKGGALIPSTLEEEGDRRLKSFGLSTSILCCSQSFQWCSQCCFHWSFESFHMLSPNVKSFLFCKVFNLTMCFKYVKLQARGSKWKYVLNINCEFI
jgi:hypothetical protein